MTKCCAFQCFCCLQQTEWLAKELRIVCSPDGCRIERRAGLWPWRRWVPHEDPYSYMGHRFRLEFPDHQSAVAYLENER